MRISDWSSDVCSSDLSINKAINSPIGELAEALWRLMPDTATEQGPMPDGLGERFEALFEANGDGGGHAACVVARHFPWIDHWFPEWTHRVIRPMLDVNHQIGRASCRERVCQYVEISVVAVSLKTQKSNK